MFRRIFLSRKVNMAVVFLVVVGLIASLVAGVMLAPAEVAAKGPVSLRDAVTAGQLKEVALVDKESPNPVMTGKTALFIDGSFYIKANSSVVKQVCAVVKSGVPTVIFGIGMEKLRADLGGNISYQTAQNEFTDGRVVDISIAAYGLKIYPGGDVEGSPVMDIITIAGGPNDMVAAVATAQEWAGRKVANTALASSGYQLSGEKGDIAAGPSWGSAKTTEFHSVDAYKLYGRLNVVCTFDRMLNDGSPTYDWRTLIIFEEIIPGIQLYKPDSKYRNADIWAIVDVNEVTANYKLIDYDPTTTPGAASCSVGITAGVDAAAFTFGKTWGYEISDVVVKANNDISTGVCNWQHDINEGAAVGSNSYKVKPGLLYRTNNNQNGTIKVRVNAQWGTPLGWPAPWKFWKSPVVTLTTTNV